MGGIISKCSHILQYPGKLYSLPVQQFQVLEFQEFSFCLSVHCACTVSMEMLITVFASMHHKHIIS